MTKAAEILTNLQRRGIAIAVEGDTLCLKPRRALDDALLAQVREAKPAILEVLRVRSSVCWHCNGTGKCDCSICGVMKPSVNWAPGECVACRARRSHLQ